MILRISALAATLTLCLSSLAFAADATYQLVSQNMSGETGTIVISAARETTRCVSTGACRRSSSKRTP